MNAINQGCSTIKERQPFTRKVKKATLTSSTPPLSILKLYLKIDLKFTSK